MKLFLVTMLDGNKFKVSAPEADTAIIVAKAEAIGLVSDWPITASDLRNAITLQSVTLIES